MYPKYWIVYYDKNNNSNGGMDWSIPTDYVPQTIKRKIQTGQFFKPKDATYYVIATDYVFKHNDYDNLRDKLPHVII